MILTVTGRRAVRSGGRPGDKCGHHALVEHRGLVRRRWGSDHRPQRSGQEMYLSG